MKKIIIHKDLEDRNLLLARLTLKLEKIMNEKKSKRRIQIRDLQKQGFRKMKTDNPLKNDTKNSSQSNNLSNPWNYHGRNSFKR